MLKAVTFDFWDTLFVYDNGPAQEQRQMRLLTEDLVALGQPRSEAAIHDALRAAYEWFDQAWVNEHRTPSAAETVGTVLATLEASLPAEAMTRVTGLFERLALDLPPELVPDAPFVVRQLASTYKLALIADTGYSPGSLLRELLQRHDLLRFFSCTYFSNEGGRSKPDGCVFRQVLTELGVHPGEAAHVGDSQRTDIVGAQAAGMLAVHFIGVNDSSAASSTGDVLIRRLEELPRALGDLSGPGDCSA